METRFVIRPMSTPRFDVTPSQCHTISHLNDLLTVRWRDTHALWYEGGVREAVVDATYTPEPSPRSIRLLAIVPFPSFTAWERSTPVSWTQKKALAPKTTGTRARSQRATWRRSCETPSEPATRASIDGGRLLVRQGLRQYRPQTPQRLTARVSTSARTWELSSISTNGDDVHASAHS